MARDSISACIAFFDSAYFDAACGLAVRSVTHAKRLSRERQRPISPKDSASNPTKSFSKLFELIRLQITPHGLTRGGMSGYDRSISRV